MTCAVRFVLRSEVYRSWGEAVLAGEMDFDDFAAEVARLIDQEIEFLGTPEGQRVLEEEACA